jgi:predicted LPLAT superfamily acyltransferase
MKFRYNKGWISRARGNSFGSRLIILVISRLGFLPAYCLLLFASVLYTLTDHKSRHAIRLFRQRIGLNTSLTDYAVHFYSFGSALIDRFFFLLSSGSEPFRYVSVNEDCIVNELSKGRGVILLGAHVGNWEIAGNLLQERVTTTVHFLMYNAESEAMKRAVEKAVRHRAVNIIYVTPEAPDSMIEMVNALRRGEVVCLHGDRVAGEMRHEHVEFLGRKAAFPIGPFVLSLLTGAPIIPFFAIKKGWRSYEFSASDPLSVACGNRTERKEVLRECLDRYVRVLEQKVRSYPEQWYNFYDFWEM